VAGCWSTDEGVPGRTFPISKKIVLTWSLMGMRGDWGLADGEEEGEAVLVEFDAAGPSQNWWSPAEAAV
jgi:hypothetical protein